MEPLEIASLKYEDLSPEQREKLARSFEEWGQRRPNLNKPIVWAGATGYTAAQIANEIREGTEFGVDFVSNLPSNTLEELDAPPRPELTREQSAAIIRERMAQVRGQLDTATPSSID
jgi:hypothetical protein